MVEASLSEVILKKRIAIYVSCRNLKNYDIKSKSDPQAEVFIKDRNSDWTLVGRTEVMRNNLNPDFAEFVECDYFFEKE